MPPSLQIKSCICCNRTHPIELFEAPIPKTLRVWGSEARTGGLGVCLALRRVRGGTKGTRVSLFMDPPRYTEQAIQGEWILAKQEPTGRIDLGKTLAQDW